jgi:hypothetical protein
MSSTTLAPSSGTARRSAGRHRLGKAAGVHCTDIPAVRERMQYARPATPHRSAFTRWFFQGVPSGRHTWNFLAGAGGRPRTAFAIILSL